MAKVKDYPTRKPRKPKKKKFPKRPKQSASANTWLNWEDRMKAVEKDNADRLKEYDKQLKLYNEGQNVKKRIQKKY